RRHPVLLAQRRGRRYAWDRQEGAMSMISPRTILVATDEGLHPVKGAGAARVDDLAGGKGGALAPARDGWWALVDGRELWRSADGSGWSMSAKVPKRRATCLATTPAGLLVGTARAHLLRLEADRLLPGR